MCHSFVIDEFWNKVRFRTAEPRVWFRLHQKKYRLGFKLVNCIWLFAKLVKYLENVCFLVIFFQFTLSNWFILQISPISLAKLTFSPIRDLIFFTILTWSPHISNSPTSVSINSPMCKSHFHQSDTSLSHQLYLSIFITCTSV